MKTLVLLNLIFKEKFYNIFALLYLFNFVVYIS